MRKAMWLIAVIATLAFSFVALAQQPTTGKLRGVVGDRDGKALPGATVIVTGPNGERGIQTDENGNFELPFLSTGKYRVKVELAGFATIEIPGVEINAGQTTRLPITLLAGQEEEVNVTAQPVIDAKRTEVATTFSAKETVETLPVGRNFTDVVGFAPGVVDGGLTGDGNYSIGGASGLENSYIIDGVNITDSGYGGVGSYSIVYGSLGTGITSQFLEEVQIKTGGFEAEYGQALGGIVAGTLKSGTNDFGGSASVYVAPSSWEANGKDVELPSGAFNIHERQETDLGVSLGGPIVKDRLFWFAGYNPTETQFETFAPFVSNPLTDSDPSASATYPDSQVYPSAGRGKEIKRSRDNYFGKLNWVISPNHRVDFTAFGDPSDGDGRSGATAGRFIMNGTNTGGPVSKVAAFSGDARRSNLNFGADQQSIKYNGLFGGEWFLEGQVNHRKNEFTEDSIVDDYAYTDNRIVREQFFSFPQTLTNSVFPTAGGAGFIGSTSDETWDYSAKLSKTFGGHELKAGLQYYDLEYLQPSIYSGPTFTINVPGSAFDTTGTLSLPTTSGGLVQVRGGIPGCTICTFSVGSPLYRVTRARFTQSDTPVKGTEQAIFLQDTWSINDKWVVKLGVRTTSQELKGSGSFTIGAKQFDPNTFKFKTEFSPRVGVSFDPSANGKTKIYLNYARYFERVPADLAVRQFSNEVGVSRASFTDPDLTRQTGGVTIQGASEGVVCGQPGTERLCTGKSRLPYQDEIVIGWQQQLRPDLSMEVRGFYRDQGRILEDTQFASVEEVQNYYYSKDYDGDGTVGNSNADTPYPGFGAAPFGAYVLANPGENTGNVFGSPKREYKAVEFTLNKQLADKWAFQANYKYSRLRGNYEGLFRNDNGQSDPNITSLFDFPAVGTDGVVSRVMRGQFEPGPLNTDRPHVLNLLGTYFFDNGLEIGSILQWQSGTPRTALLAHPQYQNAGEIPGQDPVYVSAGETSWIVSSTPQAAEAYLYDYTDAPRGSLGRNPDFVTLDLHLGYKRAIKDTSLKVTLDVNNLFNNQEAQALNDNVELTAGVLDPNFNKIIGYQLPRAIRFGVIWDF
ncbi:MAG: TonB-dependent receptor [Acidobacteriota bacterium]